MPQCPACGEAINQCLVDGKCDGFFTGCMACVLKATKPCVGCGAGMKKCFKGCQWTWDTFSWNFTNKIYNAILWVRLFF